MKDDTFTALANDHRRKLLSALAESNPQDDVRGAATGDSRETDLDRLRTEMYHQHLPKLEDYGFIRWNRDTNEVVKGPQFEEIHPVLELMDDHADELPDGWP